MALTLVTTAACGNGTGGPTGALDGELPEAEKIDGPLGAAARSGVRVPVLIVGRKQLLPGPDAFGEFTRRNENADRLTLRPQVIAQLQGIAESRRAALTGSGLPAEARVTPLWLINGVGALLTKEEIERISTHRDVASLYLLQRSLPSAPSSRVATVVTPVRAPFTFAGKRIGWNLERVGAPAAWAQGITGEGAVIALIDEAVVLTHPDLIANIWVNEDEVPGNGVDDDRNGYIDDRHGYDMLRMSPDVGTPAGAHGTFVAGILAGDGSGGIITGVAPRSRIMLLGGNSFFDVALALQYALENGADVVNMSFSQPDQFNLRGVWRLAADHAVAAGLVLVSGAGNFRQSQPIPVQLRVPEDIPSVIAVGGVDESLTPAGFSSMGPVEWGSVRFYGDHRMPDGLIKPDLVAFPGAGYPLLNTRGGYVDPNTNTRGNSFSGPHVSGAAALLLSANPRLPAWRVREILQASARDLGEPGRDNATGSGLIDIPAALARARR